MERQFPIANDNFREPDPVSSAQRTYMEFSTQASATSTSILSRNRLKMQLSPRVETSITIGIILAWAVAVIIGVNFATTPLSPLSTYALSGIITLIGLALASLGHRQNSPILYEVGIGTMIIAALALFTSLNFIYNIHLSKFTILLSGAFLSSLAAWLLNSRTGFLLASVFIGVVSWLALQEKVIPAHFTAFIGLGVINFIASRKWKQNTISLIGWLGIYAPILTAIAIPTLSGHLSYAAASLIILMLGVCQVNFCPSLSASGKDRNTAILQTSMGFYIACIGAFLLQHYWQHSDHSPWARDALSGAIPTHLAPYWYASILALILLFATGTTIRFFQGRLSLTKSLCSVLTIIAMPISFLLIENTFVDPTAKFQLDPIMASIALGSLVFGFSLVLLAKAISCRSTLFTCLGSLALSVQVTTIKGALEQSTNLLIFFGFLVLITALISALPVKEKAALNQRLLT